MSGLDTEGTLSQFDQSGLEPFGGQDGLETWTTDDSSVSVVLLPVLFVFEEERRRRATVGDTNHTSERASKKVEVGGNRTPYNPFTTSEA